MKRGRWVALLLSGAMMISQCALAVDLGWQESGAASVGAAPNGGEEGSENDDKAKVDAIVGLYNSTKSQNGGKK